MISLVMSRGVAFIHGVNMFGRNKLTKEELLNILKELEGREGFRIIGVYGSDNIIFEKRSDIHYATVGNEIERVLKKNFGKVFHVTTRSMETIRRIVSKFSG